jgi:R3H domain
MSGNKKQFPKKAKDVLIDADFRIKIEKEIMDFVHSDDMTFEFPASLTNVERAFVHKLAPKYHLQTKSSGLSECI